MSYDDVIITIIIIKWQDWIDERGQALTKNKFFVKLLFKLLTNLTNSDFHYFQELLCLVYEHCQVLIIRIYQQSQYYKMLRDLRGKHQAYLNFRTILLKVTYKIQNNGEFFSSAMLKGQILRPLYPK